MKRLSGFTLIELMIVVAIIAIIAAIAIPNLLRSRMATNETAAAVACKALAEAEDIYKRTDYNKDGILEYAQNLKGANSLFETVDGEGDVGLIDRTFALAEGDPVTVMDNGGAGKAGYCFNFIREQGVAATGGIRSYLDSTNRATLGYAFSAVPIQYDGTGRNSFIISNSGTIYQRDKGGENNKHEEIFNPDSSAGVEWAVTE